MRVGLTPHGRAVINQMEIDMKALSDWCKSALKTVFLCLLCVLMIGFSILGVCNATTMFVSLHTHECAMITEHVNLCLMPRE